MTTRGSYGVARYSRMCPLCDRYILAGSHVARHRVNGHFVWVHDTCYMPPRLAKEMKRLDTEILLTVGRL